MNCSKKSANQRQGKCAPANQERARAFSFSFFFFSLLHLLLQSFPCFPYTRRKFELTVRVSIFFLLLEKKNLFFPLFLLWRSRDAKSQNPKLNPQKEKSKERGEWNSIVINWDLKGEGKMGELV